MVSQTERAMGTVGFADPAVIDPTTSKPYTPEASMRQQQKLDRPKLNLDSNLKETVKKVMEEEPDLTKTEPSKDLPLEQEGFLRPRARPENIKPIRQSPINKILELGYLIRGESDPRSKTTKIISNFSSDNPDAIKALKGWMDSAVGGKSGLDPVKDAWCATFITHILSALGADPLKAKNTFARVRADAYRKYGTPVAPEDIREGDLVIFDWDKPGEKGYGIADHVTFYAGDRITSQGNSNYINVVGGNQWAYNAQGEEIKQVSLRQNYANYTWDKVMDVRRITYNDINYEFTEELANQDPAFLKFLESAPKKGYEKGGLSVQTEEAFNTDAEGRRRRRPSQAYLERSKEGTGQVVENVLGALPGIGTAMTVEEIQEELQKDDPNYGKIALLGGSELIGLIPGLGTAAKAGLRKVANNIGADKIIKALDAPEPKPESEIIAGPGATGYYDSNYDRAKELKERGYSPSQIEQMTGRFQTGKSSDYVGDIPENPFKFEIDDSRVEIKGSDGFQTLKESTRHYPIAVGHIIPTHTELFKEYPNLRNVAFYIDPKKTGSGAHFDPNVGSQGAIVFGPNNKSLTSPNNKNFRNTFFHELQHAAQFQDYKIAGLKQLGGNPVFFGRVGIKEYPSYKIEKDILEKNKNFVKLRDEILDTFEKQRGTGALDQTSTGAILPGQVPNPGEVFGDVAVAKKIARKMRELESELFKTYMKTVSEVESRVVGRRAEEIATVGSVPKPKVTSNLARERKIETLKEFQSDEPKSLMGKKVEDFKLKLGPMTDEEILRYATGGINFARYAKGIDKDLQGFDLFGPTKPNYAEGGTVDMNRQMEMAFMREGGLKDDGMKVDPVSGNEIPPGSMAKEVRDDIPAQLSEGEYVVPADVVQFYGVKHFEDLRNKAKGGLKQMENDGRIGGEPVYANTGTMVQGGFSGPSVAPAQPGVAQTPMPLQNPAPFNPMQTPLQGNPGAGFVYQTPGQQAYNQPTRYYGSFSNAPQSITQPPNTPVPVVGQPVTPPVDTPESCAARGMVFNPETGMCVLPDPVQTPQPTGGDDRDKPDVPQGDPDAWMDKYSYDDVDKLLSESSGALDPATGLAGFLGKVLGGGVLGLFAKGSNAAQVAANINVLSSIPESSLTASQKESLAGLKTKYKNYVTSNNLDIFGTELINGDQLAIDIITNPKNRGKGLFLTADSVDPFGNKIFKGGEKDPKFIKVMEDVASPGYTYVPGDDDNLGYYKADSDTKLAPDVSLRPPTRPTNVTPVQTTTTPTVKEDKDKKAFKKQHAAFVAKTRTDKDSMVATAEKAAKTGTAAGAAAKSYADIAKKDDEYALLNKGGLMKRK